MVLHADRLRFARDGEGNVSETRYDDAGRNVRQISYRAKPTLSAGATTADVEAAVSAIANSANDQTGLTHTDAAGRVDYTLDGEGFRTELRYDASGNVIETRVALDLAATDWAVTRHYYDAANREIFTLSPEGYLTETRYDAIGNIDCDLLITPHPAASTLYERLAGDAPLADPSACRNYAAWGREQLDARLAREAAGG